MKKTILLFVLISSALLTFAQVPQSFKYQAVIRDAGNNLLSNQLVDVKITLLNNTITVYEETHMVTTTEYGLVNLNIGQGTVMSGAFCTIDWKTGLCSVKVEVDVGSGYENLGTSDLLSVPYALSCGSNYWTDYGDNIYCNNSENVGIGTCYATQKLTVVEYNNAAVAACNINTSHSAFSVKNTYGYTGSMTGITFGVSGANGPIGAGIFHERTGTNSQGSLHFATKNSYSVDSLLPIRMTIDNEGLVGIGTTTPTSDLTIAQSSASSTSKNGLELTYFSANPWKIYHSGTYCSFACNNVRVAYVSTSGAWTLSSDKRLKENITNMESVLDRVNQLQAVRYNFIDRENSNTIGFIAQDVLPLFPEVVSKDKGEDGYYGVAYGNMSIIAIKAIQEQQKIIDEQETKIEKQDAKIDDMQTQIDELRSLMN